MCAFVCVCLFFFLCARRYITRIVILLFPSQAALRREATKELSKFSNSFTSLDSSLLFYALVFIEDEFGETNEQAKAETALTSIGQLEQYEGFLSMKNESSSAPKTPS